MRQLGVRPPEPPPVETDVQTSSEILPHERFDAKPLEPVEVHRIERNPLDPEPAERPQETVADMAPLPEAVNEAAKPVDPVPSAPDREAMEAREPVQVYRLERTPAKLEPVERPQKRPAAPHPGPPPGGARPRRDPVSFPDAGGRAPVGRWEEFHEFRHGDPRRGSRLQLEPMPVRQGSSSTLLAADLERERRSSFLTLVVPAIAALLVIAALLWSGLLQYRVHQQNAAMNALQERNQKLADTLAQMTGAQMSGEQKASRAPDSSADTPQNPATAPASATPSGENSKAVTKPEKRQRENRQGVATPPPVQERGETHTQQKGTQSRRSSDAGYAPEIVPPYPTNFKSENVAVNAANSQPVPNAGTSHPSSTPVADQRAVPVAGSDRPVIHSSTSPRAAVPQASAPLQSQSQAQPPSAKTIAPAAAPENAIPAENATQYKATGNGEYTSPLAQNIEAVEGLQRHSPVQLKEFHARAGVSTQATRNVKLSVQHPDESRGSYALVVNDGGASRQLRGQVNHPLVFTDTATHREYALVVLSIADQQVYGYVRAKE